MRPPEESGDYTLQLRLARNGRQCSYTACYEAASGEWFPIRPDADHEPIGHGLNICPLPEFPDGRLGNRSVSDPSWDIVGIEPALFTYRSMATYVTNRRGELEPGQFEHLPSEQDMDLIEHAWVHDLSHLVLFGRRRQLGLLTEIEHVWDGSTGPEKDDVSNWAARRSHYEVRTLLEARVRLFRNQFSAFDPAHIFCTQGPHVAVNRFLMCAFVPVDEDFLKASFVVRSSWKHDMEDIVYRRPGPLDGPLPPHVTYPTYHERKPQGTH